MDTGTPSGGAVVTRRPDLLWRRTPSQTLVLQPGTGRLVVLDGTAVELWDRLAYPTEVDRLVADLAAVHHAEPDVVAPDVHRALADLADRALLADAPGADH